MSRDNASAHPAARYDDEIRKVMPFYDAMQAEILDLVQVLLGAPSDWLDTGCGTGALVERAAVAFPETRFLLADPSASMLLQASARLKNNDRVRLLPAGGSVELPHLVGRNSQRVITAVLCHHYLAPEERLAAVQGCHAVLQPGGLLVVVETVDAGSELGRRYGLERWRQYQRNQGRSAQDIEAHLARFGTELKPIRVEDHLSVFEAAGFQTAELFWRSHLQGGFYAIK